MTRKLMPLQFRGGLFALNAGLITNANNMDEVAGVMAHEIAHVTQRHYSRSQEAFKGQGLLALAGILVGALVASQADGDVGSAVMVAYASRTHGQAVVL